MKSRWPAIFFKALKVRPAFASKVVTCFTVLLSFSNFIPPAGINSMFQQWPPRIQFWLLFCQICIYCLFSFSSYHISSLLLYQAMILLNAAGVFFFLYIIDTDAAHCLVNSVAFCLTKNKSFIYCFIL